MDAGREDEIQHSWKANAEAWTDAVRAGRIESRRRVTDQAVLDAILARRPGAVIDMGCGEGWLVRALAAHGIEALGVDAEPLLVQRAQQAGGGRFRVLTYAQVAGGALGERADVVAANFSLLGEHSTAALVGAVPSLLRDGGVLIVQTLHPWRARGAGPYADGWREGSWDGCGPGFGRAGPWYFRTLEGWTRLLARSGLRLQALREPVDPASGQPASMLLVAGTV